MSKFCKRIIAKKPGASNVAIKNLDFVPSVLNTKNKIMKKRIPISAPAIVRGNPNKFVSGVDTLLSGFKEDSFMFLFAYLKTPVSNLSA
ncbi:MAG: hypothetical protein JW730_17985 [Anaerolineales bacterium]|nr:hypothetical protein [Anaerolineales bacterium]